MKEASVISITGRCKHLLALKSWAGQTYNARQTIADATAEIERLRRAIQYIGETAHADGIDNLASFCEETLDAHGQQSVKEG